MNSPLPRDFARLHDGNVEALSHGSLWSWWEMLELKIAPFYDVVSKIQHTRTAIEYRNKIPGEGGRQSSNLMTDETFVRVMCERIDDLLDSLSTLNARITTMAAQELRDRLSGLYLLSYSELINGFEDISLTLRRELSGSKALILEPKERDYFSPSHPLFGEKFTLGFALDGVFEVDEAAKCLGLRRPTACVFHLMRTLEVGIRATARCLGVPDPLKPAERNWGSILKAIKDGIETKWSAPMRMNGDGALFEEIHASLDAVRNPWRNATMHVEKKYTDDEAEHIFVVVKGFMKKLSSRCDENGDPKA